MGRFIDISMPVREGLRSNHSRPGEELRVTYDVRPEDDPDKRKTVRRISTRLHVGTHVDGPEHLVLGAKRLDELPVERFAGPALVIDMRHKVPRGIITADDLERAAGPRLRPADILIVRTGWNAHYFDASFFDDSPYFNVSAADWCISHRTKMVAVDFLCDPIAPDLQVEGVDAFKRRVLAAEIPVLTNADGLDRIRAERVTLYAFPLYLVPSEAGLTRAVVWED